MNLAYLLSPSMAPVQKQIVDNLEARDFLALESVSKDVRTGIQHGTSSAYKISLILGRFFQDPKAFQRMQVRSGLVIGGDFARAFFNGTTASVHQLHVFVKYDDCEHVEQYLVADGWAESSIEGPTEHREADCMYQKTVKGQLLSIYCYAEPSPLACIFENAATTASLNFITSSKAYALVPRETFVEKNAYLIQNLDDVDYGTMYRTHLEEIAEQGIKTLALHWDDETGDDGDIALKRLRRIGDKQTWIIPLDTSGIESDEAFSAAIEQSTFQIHKFEGQIEQRGRVDRYAMDASWTFSHAILKHTYLTPIRETTEKSCAHAFVEKIKALASKMDALTTLELSRVREEERPDDYEEFMSLSTLIDEFDWDGNPVPQTWTYFDQELVKQLGKLWKEYEREQAKKMAAKNDAHESKPTE